MSVSPTASSVRVGGSEGTRDARGWMRLMTGHTAYLRVYEPLAALPDAERARWHAYVEAGTAPSRPVLMAREHDRSVAATLSAPPRLDVGGDADEAYVRHLDGLTYVCPWRLQIRTWEALAAVPAG